MIPIRELGIGLVVLGLLLFVALFFFSRASQPGDDDHTEPENDARDYFTQTVAAIKDAGLSLRWIACQDGGHMRAMIIEGLVMVERFPPGRWPAPDRWEWIQILVDNSQDQPTYFDALVQATPNGIPVATSLVLGYGSFNHRAATSQAAELATLEKWAHQLELALKERQRVEA